jgi:hypothetical protein
MSNEQNVKTEGSFKIKTKPKLTEEQLGAKNKEPLIDVPSNMTRVVIPNKDNLLDQEAVSLDVNESPANIPPNDEGIQELGLQDITEEEKKIVKPFTIKEASNPVPVDNELPEGVNKLLAFMKETGGSIQDYAKLNTDYSAIDRDELVKEYYKKTKSHLDAEEINYLIEDNFAFDEDIDEERDIRRKKLAYKEEVAKAKAFLEDNKSKYYEDIKLKPQSTPDQQKATDFFNRYNEDQARNLNAHTQFKDATTNYFANDFKGFDFNLGEKKFRYAVSNAEKVGEDQADISNFIGGFLGEDGSVLNPAAYHKALYAGANADKMANHFYEQGKADAIRDVVNKSNNISSGARKSAPVDSARFGAYKIKSVSGADSSKLKIKKFNK